MDQLEASALSIIDPATISVVAHSEEFVRFGKQSRDTDVEVGVCLFVALQVNSSPVFIF